MGSVVYHTVGDEGKTARNMRKRVVNKKKNRDIMSQALSKH
jgi:hypothetical protein